MKYFDDKKKGAAQRGHSGGTLPDIDTLCIDIVDGNSYRDIAQMYKVTLSQLYRVLSLDANIPRVNIARQLASNVYAERALEALLNAERTMPGVTLAREECAYWKWLASKVSPRQWGDHSTVDVTQTTRKIVVKEQPILDVVGTQLPPMKILKDTTVPHEPAANQQQTNNGELETGSQSGEQPMET